MDIATTTAVTVDQHVHYREHGYLIVRGLLDAGEVGELLEHVEELTAATPTCCASTCCTGGSRSTSATCCTRGWSTWSPGSSARTCSPSRRCCS